MTIYRASLWAVAVVLAAPVGYGLATAVCHAAHRLRLAVR